MSLVEDTFAPAGLLAKSFPGHEPRPMQLGLSRAVEKAIDAGESLLAEGPTGVGKGFAYLVPAIAHAVETGSRVLVVTANIALQEQLVTKDLPALRALLPVPFEFGLAKGRSNYLCLSQLDDSIADRAVIAGREYGDLFDAIVEWAGQTQAGDLSELPFEPAPQLRQLFTVSADDCLGKQCPRHDECFPNRARAALQGAQIVVANYHLFFSDLRVRSASEGEAAILPAYDVLICDEAHKLADIARGFFGFRVSPGAIRHAARLLAGVPARGGKGAIPEIDPRLKLRLLAESDKFFDALLAHAKGPAYKARLRAKDPVPSGGFLAVLAETSTRYEQEAERGDVDAVGRKKLRQASARLAEVATAISAAMNPDASRAEVFYVETEGGKPALCSKLVDAGPVLRKYLFENPELRSTIAASATLTTDGGSFEFVREEVGAVCARTIAVDSPFEFADRALLVVPEEHEVDLPNEAGFARSCAAAFARIAGLARGRTLGLFTTRAGMDRAYDVAANELSGEYVILKQGDAPRTQLVERFRADVSSVLIGTASLWEGVDVRGEALSCVVIDKLPFPTPDDPVLDALDARERDVFTKHFLPRALIAFRQGFGRLIRSRSDRGVVVCLDRRIVEKGYGRKFVRALPRGVRLSRDLGDVRRFLDGKVEVEGDGGDEARERIAATIRAARVQRRTA